MTPAPVEPQGLPLQPTPGVGLVDLDSDSDISIRVNSPCRAAVKTSRRPPPTLMRRDATGARTVMPTAPEPHVGVVCGYDIENLDRVQVNVGNLAKAHISTEPDDTTSGRQFWESYGHVADSMTPGPAKLWHTDSWDPDAFP